MNGRVGEVEVGGTHVEMDGGVGGVADGEAYEISLGVRLWTTK
jgi:hypothetical protein